MAKRYTKDGQQMYKAGDKVEGKYCVSEAWLQRNGYYEYTTKAEDGTDGVVDNKWVHYTGAPYVAPEPEPYVPTEAEVAAQAEAARKANIQSQIDALKAELSASDYKVIKCAECQLAGLDAPYDISEIHAERQQLRDNINALEAELNVEEA